MGSVLGGLFSNLGPSRSVSPTRSPSQNIRALVMSEKSYSKHHQEEQSPTKGHIRRPDFQHDLQLKDERGSCPLCLMTQHVGT